MSFSHESNDNWFSHKRVIVVVLVEGSGSGEGMQELGLEVAWLHRHLLRVVLDGPMGNLHPEAFACLLREALRKD